MRVTLSANAGVSIDFAGKRIWIDALHERNVQGFSTVTPDLYAQLLQNDNFKNPDVICYTHCHPDHFSKKLTLDAALRWPGVKVISPESVADGWIKVEGDRWKMSFGNVQIIYIQLPHEGDAYTNAVHYGIILSDGKRNVLLPGDCQICSDSLADAVDGLHINLALLDFPWVTLPKGSRFLDKHISPDHICLFHLPFAADDINGYRAAAYRAVEKCHNDIELLTEAFQSVQY